MSRTSPVAADEDYRYLRVLEEIECNPRVSQRQIARDLDVALGVANACVRTLVRKGLIKVRGESNRSLTYHLTKEGRAHKARLAMKWTGNTIDYYVQARARIRGQLEAIVASGVSEVSLYGADEVAELVTLLGPGAGLGIGAVYERGGTRIADEIAGIPVLGPERGPEVTGVLLLPSLPSEAEIASIAQTFPHATVMLLSGETLGRDRTEEAM